MTGIGAHFPAQSLFGPNDSLLGIGNLPARHVRADRQSAAIPRKSGPDGAAGAIFPCLQGIRVR
jgi:hypothetical protein